MKIPQLARYNGVVEKAYEFVNKNIYEFPINPFDLIKKFKWGLITYEQMAIKNNCTIDDISECLGIDGYSIYNGKNHTIAYNNKIQSQGRINFTLSHEIGHIVLGHHKDFDATTTLKSNFTKEEYKILENEANCFARNILAPAPLVNNLNFWNMFFDMPNYFDITFKAATTRLTFLNNDLYYLNENQIRSFQTLYKQFKECPICGARTTVFSSNYCEKCGNKLNRGDGFKMRRYEGMYVLPQCPHCENVDIYNDDNYCIICGKSLENKCTKCGNTLPYNARYCNKCGSKSTYFESGELSEVAVSDGKLLNRDEELTSNNWKIILENIKRQGHIVLYTNLIHSQLLIVNENTFRN